jgi:hypothetical protein
MSVCPSVRSHGTTRFPLHGFQWNCLFEYFSNICRENSSFTTMWPEGLIIYMNTCISVWQYLAHFFLEWEMFWQICGENRNARFLFNNFFFLKSAVYGIMWINIVERGRPKMTIWRTRIACWIPKHINKFSECVILIAFPLQQWLHKSASILRYTQIASLVQKPLFLSNSTDHLTNNETKKDCFVKYLI